MERGTWVLLQEPKRTGEGGRPWEIWGQHRKGAEESTHTHVHFTIFLKSSAGAAYETYPLPLPSTCEKGRGGSFTGASEGKEKLRSR